MRDDFYDLTRAERRQAVAGWRRVPSRQRLESVHRAEQGLPATDPRVSAAAHGYGRYLLLRNRSNRLPRSLLALAGAVVTVLGVLLWSGAVTVFGEVETGLGVFVTTGGVVVTLMGLVSWSQRQGAVLLVAANPEVSASSEGADGSTGGARPCPGVRR